MATPPRPIFTAVVALRDALLRLTQRLVPGRIALFDFIGAAWLSDLTYLAAALKIPDHIASGARTADELARATGANPDALARLLRALEGVGLLEKDDEQRYANNAVSEALREGVTGSLRDLALFYGSPWHRTAWSKALDSVMTGEGAFQLAFGKPVFQWFGEHPGEAALFDRAMRNVTALDAAAIVDGYPFGELKDLCDVGGGIGMLLDGVLTANPGLRGTLVDMPQVIERARVFLGERGVLDRCTLVGGDFFRDVPEGCDAYCLKNILHDWDDARCLQILGAIRRAARAGSRLLIIEMILCDDIPRRFPGKLLDLQMLVFTEGGRQRTPDELRALLSRAGFRLDRVVRLSSPVSVAEAVAV